MSVENIHRWIWGFSAEETEVNNTCSNEKFVFVGNRHEVEKRRTYVFAGETDRVSVVGIRFTQHGRVGATALGKRGKKQNNVFVFSSKFQTYSIDSYRDPLILATCFFSDLRINTTFGIIPGWNNTNASRS